MIFATGFAPFRGGPMHYARTRGVADVRDTLARLAQKYGAALPARSGLGQLEMIRSGAGPARFRRCGAAGRCHRRAGRQDHRAGAAARPRQGQSHRQRALRQGGGRPLDPADHLHRADARAAARQERAGAALPRPARAARCSPAIRRSTMRRRSTPARCRRISQINEFFFEAGQWLGSPYAQQHYISRELHPCAALRARPRRQRRRRNWWRIAPTRAPHPFSLSCNPDLTLDLLALRRDGRVDFLFAGQINSELPFMRRRRGDRRGRIRSAARQPGDRFSAVRAAARADRARRLCRGAARREHRAGRRHAADRHRLAGRRGRAGADPAPPRQRRDFRDAARRACGPTPVGDAARRTRRRSRPASMAAPKCSSKACSICTAPASSSARSMAPCCTPASSSARARSTAALREMPRDDASEIPHDVDLLRQRTLSATRTTSGARASMRASSTTP